MANILFSQPQISFSNVLANDIAIDDALLERPIIDDVVDIFNDTNDNSKHKEKYNPKTILYIRIAYILILIIWLLLVIVLPLGKYGFFGTLILLIPPIIILIGFLFIEDMTLEFEDSIFKTNLMSIGLLIIVPLLTWTSNNYQGSLHDFIIIVLVSILISLCSMIEAWTDRRWTSIFKHARSALQTISLTLLIYAIYLYLRNEYIPQCP